MQYVPKVSVVIPVFNAAPYLANALESILVQSFPEFELIAVDDGSTDGSATILDRVALRDSRVVIIRQANSGIVKALNAGIGRARGDYIARMDADDIAWPDRFARQVAWLDAHPEIVALGTQIRLIDPEGRTLTRFPLPCDHADIDARLLRDHGLSICHPSAMIRRSALLRIGCYSVAYPHAEDIDLWLRLGEIGKLENLNEILLDYRMHFRSVGMTKRQQQIDSAHDAARAAAARRGIPFSQVASPPSTGRSPAENYRRWGWWALMDGNVATARHYALRGLRASPFSTKSWRLAMMAIRGR